MVQRLASKPFTLLGINSDQSRSALQKIIREQGITWPQIFDGSRGPIAKQWNVKSFPTIYVIDQKGIIRYRNVRGEALEKAVAGLLGLGPRIADTPTTKPAKPPGDRPRSDSGKPQHPPARTEPQAVAPGLVQPDPNRDREGAAAQRG